jgi:hypothetical protein
VINRFAILLVLFPVCAVTLVAAESNNNIFGYNVDRVA